MLLLSFIICETIFQFKIEVLLKNVISQKLDALTLNYWYHQQDIKILYY